MGLRALDDTRISERNNVAGTSAFVVSDRWAKQAAAIRARKDSYFPSHVKACINNPDHDRRWSLALWRKDGPGNITLVPYTCGSWRCPSPECQRAAAHADFARIDEGIKKVLDSGGRADGWVMLVLTIDSLGTLSEGIDASGKKWSDEQHAYRQLSRNSRNFLARLKRWAWLENWEQTGNRWVATVEAQGNGWPHINLLIYSPGLADWLRANPSEIVNQPGALRGELREAAVGTCWGPIGYAQPADNLEGLAGYITKTAGNFAKTVGEISKLTQIPVNARMKVRRIRAGRGFLRRPPKDEAWTGIMLKRGHTMSGHLMVDTLMKPENVKCPQEEQASYLEGVRGALALELERYKADAAGEPVKVVSRPEDRAKTVRKALHDRHMVSVLVALECISKIGVNDNAKNNRLEASSGPFDGRSGRETRGESRQGHPGPRLHAELSGQARVNRLRDDFDKALEGPRTVAGKNRRTFEGIRHLSRVRPEVPAPIQGVQSLRLKTGFAYANQHNKPIIDKG